MEHGADHTKIGEQSNSGIGIRILRMRAITYARARDTRTTVHYSVLVI